MGWHTSIGVNQPCFSIPPATLPLPGGQATMGTELVSAHGAGEGRDNSARRGPTRGQGPDEDLYPGQVATVLA